MKIRNSPDRIETRSYPVVIPTSDGSAVAYEVPVEVPMEWHQALGEWLITAEAEEIIESTKARHMGLMLPTELADLRRRLRMTQAQMGDLLCIGEKTWTRWESGRQRPSQSLNLLIRALASGLVTIYDLRQLRQPDADWSTAFAAHEPQIVMPMRLRPRRTADAGAEDWERSVAA